MVYRAVALTGSLDDAGTAEHAQHATSQSEEEEGSMYDGDADGSSSDASDSESSEDDFDGAEGDAAGRNRKEHAERKAASASRQRRPRAKRCDSKMSAQDACRCSAGQWMARMHAQGPQVISFA